MTYYEIKKAQIRSEAIQWQYDFQNRPQSWFQVSESTAYFQKFGKQYGLLKEFRENGII